MRVDMGVAAGVTQIGTAGKRSESWMLFETREQFEHCCEDDPARFTDPVMFAKFRREFDHVLNEPSDGAFQLRLMLEP